MQKYIKGLMKFNIKSISIGLVLFGLSLFMYEGVQPYVMGYFAYQRSNATPFIKISYPDIQHEEQIYPTDITQISFAQLKQFATNNYENPIFERAGSRQEIVYNRNKISHLQISPDQQRIGFYQFFLDKTGYERVSLIIMDFNKRNFNEIKDENDNFSNWKWRDNSTVDIGINCGSSCHYTQVTSIENGQIIAQYFKGRKFHF